MDLDNHSELLKIYNDSEFLQNLYFKNINNTNKKEEEGGENEEEFTQENLEKILPFKLNLLINLYKGNYKFTDDTYITIANQLNFLISKNKINEILIIIILKNIAYISELNDANLELFSILKIDLKKHKNISESFNFLEILMHYDFYEAFIWFYKTFKNIDNLFLIKISVDEGKFLFFEFLFKKENDKIKISLNFLFDIIKTSVFNGYLDISIYIYIKIIETKVDIIDNIGMFYEILSRAIPNDNIEIFQWLYTKLKNKILFDLEIFERYFQIATQCDSINIAKFLYQLDKNIISKLTCNIESLFNTNERSFEIVNWLENEEINIFFKISRLDFLEKIIKGVINFRFCGYKKIINIISLLLKKESLEKTRFLGNLNNINILNNLFIRIISGLTREKEYNKESYDMLIKLYELNIITEETLSSSKNASKSSKNSEKLLEFLDKLEK